MNELTQHEQSQHGTDAHGRVDRIGALVSVRTFGPQFETYPFDGCCRGSLTAGIDVVARACWWFSRCGSLWRFSLVEIIILKFKPIFERSNFLAESEPLVAGRIDPVVVISDQNPHIWFLERSISCFQFRIGVAFEFFEIFQLDHRVVLGTGRPPSGCVKLADYPDFAPADLEAKERPHLSV